MKIIALSISLAFLFTHLPLHAEENEIIKELAEIYAIENSVEKLAAYDALAEKHGAKGTTEITPAAANNKWQFKETTDAVTDKTVKYANITLNVKPCLLFRKTGSELEALINVGTSVHAQNVLSNYMPTVLRMDKNKPVHSRWSFSTDKVALFHPDPKLLAKVLTETDTILIRFQPYGHGDITVEFDTRGFDEVYKKF
jgi:hypothetical protein